MNNPIILVDFDGVLHSYTSGWRGVDVIPDPPVPGAIEWLHSMLPPLDQVKSYTGPIARIYSSRSKTHEGVVAMKRWLIQHGLKEEYITRNLLKFPIEKPAAFLTIDDRCFCFEGKFPNPKSLLDFVPWNKIPKRK